MYDTPIKGSYHYANFDFGAATDVTWGIAVPVGGPRSHASEVGMTGKVVRVMVHNVTENFQGDTDGGVQVGDGSDVDKYYDSGLVLDETLDVGEVVTPADDGSQVNIEEGRTNIVVTMIACTGTPTGIADVTVDIDWY